MLGNYLTRIKAKYYSLISRFSSLSRAGKLKLFALLLIVLVIPLTVVMALTVQNLQQRASGPNLGVICEASDIIALQSCKAGLINGTYDSIHITQMIECSDPATCRIDLSSLFNKTIYGEPNWTTGIKRTGGGIARGPIITVGLDKPNTSNIVIKDLVLDDGYTTFDSSEWKTSSCPFSPNPRLVRPLQLMSGKNITVDHVNVKNFNETGVWANNMDGFTFKNSVISHGQHLAMVIGTAQLGSTGTFPPGWGPSRNVTIKNNKFENIGVNGLVIDGVRGSAYGQNIIEGNSFRSVHEHGLYDCQDQRLGNIYSGGMLLITDADYLNVESNTFNDGYCDNCSANSGGRVPHEVVGVELDGKYLKKGFQVATKNVRFLNNSFNNFTGYSFHHNYCNPGPCPNWKDYGPLENIYFKGNAQTAAFGLFPPARTFGALVGTNIVFDNSTPSPSPRPNGDKSISTQVLGKTLTISTKNKYAGAIGSLLWNGKEFINTWDHGRQLQTAIQLNGVGECNNPTEAGSRDDGRGNQSSSVLNSISAAGNTLTTDNSPAFWLKNGQYSPVSNCTARDLPVNPDYKITKNVQIGYKGIDNVVEYKVTETIPRNQTAFSTEANTAYLTSDFSDVWTFDNQTESISKISNSELGKIIDKPVIASTPDGKYALGVLGENPDLTNSFHFVGPYYVGQKFLSLTPQENATVKWSCRYRTNNVALNAGEYTFKCNLIVGTLSDVRNAMVQLSRISGTSGSPKGNFESASNTATGWTCDSDDYSRALSVSFYADAPYASGGTPLGTVVANQSRESSIATRCGGVASHGFSYTIPQNLRTGNHTLYAYAINVGGGNNSLLSGSPITIGNPTPTPTPTPASGPPIGNHDASSCTVSTGWTCDPDNYGQSLQVHFYADGKFGEGGRFVGSTTASTVRADGVGNRCFGFTAHGFNFNTPQFLKDGKTHTLYAYAINIGVSGANPLLSASGKQITCSVSSPVPSVSPSSSPTVTPTPTTTPTPTPSSPPIAGDFNGDGKVNRVDFSIWRDEFRGVSLTRRSDANRDGIIDLRDYNVWRKHFNP